MTTVIRSSSAPIKGILIKKGTPRTNRRNNVIFNTDVTVIGKSETISLSAPADTNDELTFDYNPPTNPVLSKSTSGRSGTMRIKGPSVIGGKKNGGGRASVLSLYSQPEETKKVEREATVIEGYLKLLKESGMKSSWVKRYLTLTNSKIAYYKSKDASSPIKSFEITSDSYVREISQKAGVTNCKDALEVFYKRKKSIILKGNSQKESTEWITSICTVIDALTPDNDSDDEFDFYDEDDFVETSTLQSKNNNNEPFSTPLSASNDLEFYDEDEFVETSSLQVIKNDDPFSTSITTKYNDDFEDEYEFFDEDDMEDNEEQLKREKEQKKAEEAKKLEEEKKREQEEQKKAAESKRLAEEKKAAESKRLEEEKKRKEEEKKAAEAKRLAEEKKAEEAKKLSAQKKVTPVSKTPAVRGSNVPRGRGQRGPRGLPKRTRGTPAVRGSNNSSRGSPTMSHVPSITAYSNGPTRSKTSTKDVPRESRVGNLMKMFDKSK